jgi:two-component system, NarL family, sensor kinase
MNSKIDQTILINFRSLVESISPLITIDKDFTIHFVNETFKKEFRIGKRTLIGKNFFEVFKLEPNDKEQLIYNVSVSDKQRIHNKEFIIKEHIYGYSIFRFTDEIGIILKDITMIKRLEKKIESLHSRLLNVQEKERQNLARELHDGVGQTILAAKLNFAFYEKDPVKYIKNFEKGLVLIDIASQELREIYTNLYPSTLSELGLESAIRSFNKDFLELGERKVNLKIVIKSKLSHELEVNVYRIIQEISTNIVKHAKATIVDMHICIKDTFLQILIRDNGIGFDENDLLKKETKGFGLQNIRRRVEDMKGIIIIQSSPILGTNFDIRIPIGTKHGK